MLSQGRKALVGVFLLAALPAVARALCGDLNNDGERTTADAILLSQCVANGGICPAAVPGPLCGTGHLADCGDLLGDGDVSFPVGQNADLAVLLQSLAGLATLYDICTGPGLAPAGCPGDLTLATQTITSSQTWPADCSIHIAGVVFVETPAGGPTTVLKIAPGSVIKSRTAADLATLIFLPGSHIDAQGTPAQPIIFTSDQPEGMRTPGAWGGLMFNGRSTINTPGCQWQGDGTPQPFGGCFANDSSGIASFVRVEFGGDSITPESHLPGIQLNAVGSQTQFNFLQAHALRSDCFAWFGGTSTHRHLVASACGDDGFDLQLGFTGSLQYAVLLENGQLTAAAERDARGIELDNSEFDSGAVPRSDPAFCNVTLIGSKAQQEFPDNGGSDVGIMLRRGTHGRMANLIVTGFQDAGVELRDASTTQQACSDSDANGVPEALTGAVMIRNSVFFDNGAGGDEQAKDNDGSLDTTAGADLNACAAPACACDTEVWYAALAANFGVVNANGEIGVDPGVSDQYPELDNTACAAAGTPYTCCSGAGAGSCRAIPDLRYRSATSGLPAPFPCSSLDPLFTAADYLGAIDPQAACSATHCDWLSKPWLEFAVQ